MQAEDGCLGATRRTSRVSWIRRCRRLTALTSAIAGGLLHIPSIALGAEGDPPPTPSYELTVAYLADAWRNTRGGLRVGNAYLENIDLTLAIDGERAWSLPGLSAFTYALYTNRARFSERYVGDAMTVSNIDAPETLRLYEAWLQWQSDGSLPFSARFGLYDLNAEFDTLASRALFLHSAHGIGHDVGQSGANGPSIFPVTSLAARFAWSPVRQWTVLVAALDGTPGDPDHPASNRIHFDRDDLLTIAEIQRSGERITKLAVGYWRYTGAFEDLRSTATEPLPARHDNSGTYAEIEVALGVPAITPQTSAFLRVGHAKAAVNEFSDSWSVGLRHRGAIAARPDDEIGIAFVRADVGDPARTVANASDVRRGIHESAIELTYRATLTDWCTIQPDVQYIRHPNADPTLEDSVAIGLRVEISAAWSR